MRKTDKVCEIVTKGDQNRQRIGKKRLKDHWSKCFEIFCVCVHVRVFVGVGVRVGVPEPVTHQSGVTQKH